MNDPLDQAQALEAMDAVAGLYDFVNANVGELLRKSGEGLARFGFVCSDDSATHIQAIVNVINARQNTNCHGLVHDGDREVSDEEQDEDGDDSDSA